MRYSLTIIFAIVSLTLLFCSCTKTITDPPNGNILDTCGNSLPITPLDSVYNSWWRAQWKTQELTLSQSKNSFACYHYLGLTFQTGVSIYDLFNKNPVIFIPRAMRPTWSPDGKSIAYILYGSQFVFTYTIETGKTTQITPLGDFSYISWDRSSDYIYLSRATYHPGKPYPDNKWGTFRVKPDGSEFDWVTDSLLNAEIIDENTLIGLNHQGTRIIKYFISSIKIESDTVLGFENNTVDVRNTRLSPDKSRFVFDRTPKKPMENGQLSAYGGIWILDLKTKTSYQLIPMQQAWPNEIYPCWYSNSEILCSLFCRKDTAITTWLFNANGNVIRQITNKGMRLIP